MGDSHPRVALVRVWSAAAAPPPPPTRTRTARRQLSCQGPANFALWRQRKLAITMRSNTELSSSEPRSAVCFYPVSVSICNSTGSSKWAKMAEEDFSQSFGVRHTKRHSTFVTNCDFVVTLDGFVIGSRTLVGFREEGAQMLQATGVGRLMSPVHLLPLDLNRYFLRNND